MGKEALAVKRDVLFKNGVFQGFVSSKLKDFVQEILQNHSYYPRGDELEHDASLQQVIPYVWIINPLERKVFLYKRAVNQNKAEGEFRETRYMNKYSGGVGGHIDRDTEEGSANPIERAMIREILEEVEIEGKFDAKIVGYINDDSDNIGIVHFGVVAIAETLGSVKSKESEGLASGAFYSTEEVERIFANPENKVENWTQISWPFVKQYLLSR
jgi:predicted NUDIX family phosphoesterase